MNKKGSMELSVNSIVILVIAIVMLGLILGFVKSKFGDLDKQLVNNEPDAQSATPSERLTISRETIAVSGGEETVLKIQAYAVRSISSDAINHPLIYAVPNVTCDGLDVSSNVQAKDVEQGQVAKYTMKLKIPSVSRGKYLCSLRMVFQERMRTNADGTIVVDSSGAPIVDPEVKLEKDLLIEVK
jgi:hypothetical protein